MKPTGAENTEQAAAQVGGWVASLGTGATFVGAGCAVLEEVVGRRDMFRR